MTTSVEKARRKLIPWLRRQVDSAEVETFELQLRLQSSETSNTIAYGYDRSVEDQAAEILALARSQRRRLSVHAFELIVVVAESEQSFAFTLRPLRSRTCSMPPPSRTGEEALLGQLMDTNLMLVEMVLSTAKNIANQHVSTIGQHVTTIARLERENARLQKLVPSASTGGDDV